MAFAERFPTEAELSNVLDSGRSWHDICRDNFKADKLDEADIVEPVEPAPGTYRTIAADPPWQYGNMATRGAAEDHYPTLSIEKLCEIDVPAWSADEAHLYLWVTNGFLREGFLVLDAWGFDYKTTLTWVKPQMGLGNYFRNNTEHVLFGVRGGLHLVRYVPTSFKAKRDVTARSGISSTT